MVSFVWCGYPLDALGLCVSVWWPFLGCSCLHGNVASIRFSCRIAPLCSPLLSFPKHAGCTLGGSECGSTGIQEGFFFLLVYSIIERSRV